MISDTLYSCSFIIIKPIFVHDLHFSADKDEEGNPEPPLFCSVRPSMSN
jgi:hypothetical protein